ncbi:MAG: hypothetical protein K1X66_02940 [Verrucomicrobiae bacterium]|nr:hypothetical protein [Verrucomicrobiae bacterium]
MNFLKNREWCQALWLCVPAIVLGVALRVLLLSHMPYAFFHDDTRHLLGTGVKWVEQGRWDISERRTFLVPLIYAIPLIAKWQLLRSIALGQHALGLLMVMEVGLICFLWFRYWRFWIVPLTLIFAIHPSLLWYEHLALQEFLYVFGAVTVALMSTWFYRFPSWKSFSALFIAIFLTAGARPEGNLFCFLGLGMVIAVWGKNWKTLAIHLGVGIMISGFIFKLTPTNQGGKLLLATLMPLLPDRTLFYPEVAAELQNVRMKVRANKPWFIQDITPIRKKTETVVNEYLKQNFRKEKRPDTDKVCKRLGVETGLRYGYELPKIALYKFLASHRDAKIRGKPTALVAGSFGEDWVYEGQTAIMFKASGEPSNSWHYLPWLLGKSYHSAENLRADLKQIYRVFQPDFLTRFQEIFSNLVLGWHLPSFFYQGTKLPGLPIIYLVGLVGLIGLGFQRRRFVVVWLAMLIFLAFAIYLVGNIRARFRLVLEPFIFISFFAFWDWVIARIRHNSQEA